MSKLTDFQQREATREVIRVTDMQEVFPRGTVVECSGEYGVVLDHQDGLGGGMSLYPVGERCFLAFTFPHKVTKILSIEEINQLTNKEQVHRIIGEMVISDKQEEIPNEQITDVGRVRSQV